MSTPSNSTFFTEVHEMVRVLGPVGIIFGIEPATGKLTAHASPCPVDDKAEQTLCEPLFLRGTVEEFDAQFIAALMNYRPQIASFNEQIAANYEKVEQAGKAAATKAANSGAKKGGTPTPPKPTTPPTNPASPGSAATSRGEGGAAGERAATPQGTPPASQASLFETADQA